MPALNPSDAITVWSGEWAYVKQGVSVVRRSVSSSMASISATFDIPGYLAMVKKYSAEADTYITSKTLRATEHLEANTWIAPATGIFLTSVFISVKSAPWGGYRMLRNGAGTAAILSALIFPLEIVHHVDRWLPFKAPPMDERLQQANRRIE